MDKPNGVYNLAATFNNIDILLSFKGFAGVLRDDCESDPFCDRFEDQADLVGKSPTGNVLNTGMTWIFTAKQSSRHGLAIGMGDKP